MPPGETSKSDISDTFSSSDNSKKQLVHTARPIEIGDVIKGSLNEGVNILFGSKASKDKLNMSKSDVSQAVADANQTLIDSVTAKKQHTARPIEIGDVMKGSVNEGVNILFGSKTGKDKLNFSKADVSQVATDTNLNSNDTSNVKKQHTARPIEIGDVMKGSANEGVNILFGSHPSKEDRNVSKKDLTHIIPNPSSNAISELPHSNAGSKKHTSRPIEINEIISGKTSEGVHILFGTHTKDTKS